MCICNRVQRGPPVRGVTVSGPPGGGKADLLTRCLRSTPPDCCPPAWLLGSRRVQVSCLQMADQGTSRPTSREPFPVTVSSVSLLVPFLWRPHDFWTQHSHAPLNGGVAEPESRADRPDPLGDPQVAWSSHAAVPKSRGPCDRPDSPMCFRKMSREGAKRKKIAWEAPGCGVCSCSSAGLPWGGDPPAHWAPEVTADTVSA